MMIDHPLVRGVSSVAALLFKGAKIRNLGVPARLSIVRPNDVIGISKETTTEAFGDKRISFISACRHSCDAGDGVLFATPSEHTTKTWRILRPMTLEPPVPGPAYSFSFAAPRSGQPRVLSVTSRAKPCPLHLRLVMQMIGIADVVFLGKIHKYTAAHLLDAPISGTYSFRIALMSDSQTLTALDAAAEIESHGYTISSTSKANEHQGRIIRVSGG